MSERPKNGVDPDATVMIPRSQSDDASDPDATVMIPASRVDDDVTVMIPSQSADDDATVMIPAREREADDDATVMIPAGGYVDGQIPMPRLSFRHPDGGAMPFPWTCRPPRRQGGPQLLQM